MATCEPFSCVDRPSQIDYPHQTSKNDPNRLFYRQPGGVWAIIRSLLILSVVLIGCKRKMATCGLYPVETGGVDLGGEIVHYI
jgi:hypothetical protein